MPIRHVSPVGLRAPLHAVPASPTRHCSPPDGTSATYLYRSDARQCRVLPSRGRHPDVERPAPRASTSTVHHLGTGTSSQSEAHKGYAVRLVSTPAAGSYIGPVQRNHQQLASAARDSPTTCGTISAMDDMTIFTPVNGATRPSSPIPLFSIDPTHTAGQTIDVDLFDIGDVGGGAAYVGLQAPDGSLDVRQQFTDLGASLGGASPPGGPAPSRERGRCRVSTACFSRPHDPAAGWRSTTGSGCRYR